LPSLSVASAVMTLLPTGALLQINSNRFVGKPMGKIGVAGVAVPG
jgi:hypothetical protein